MTAFIQKKVKPLCLRHRNMAIMCLLAAALCAIYAGLLASKSLSPAEGWYSYYAYLINEEGAIPYLDFELLFPPLYVYIIAFFTRIFGYELIALRVFGVVIYAITGIFACLIFKKLTKSPLIGFIGGMLCVAVLQSEIVQIFYDYIRVMDMFVYISVYFFLRYLDKVQLTEKLRPRFDANIVVAAIFAVLASMCKQSSGLIFLLFCTVFFIFLFICLPSKKELALQTGVIVGVAVILWGAMIAILAKQGSLKAFIRYNFISSVDAKGGGSLIQVLFGWIPRSMLSVIIGILIALAVALLFIWFRYIYVRRKHFSNGFSPKHIKKLYVIAPIVLLIAVTVPFAFNGWAWLFAKLNVTYLSWIMFMFCTAFFAFTAFAVIFRKKLEIPDWQMHFKFVFLSGVIFALAFSVCTSGGLAESQIALGYAFVLIVLISIAWYYKKEFLILIACAAMLLQTSISFSRKVNETYAWWGMSTGPYADQTQKCDVPIFKGIEMNTEYAQMYNNVYYGITESTASDEEIFVFPHMPVFYLATERSRATFTAIQWFDVSTDTAVEADIEVIKEKKPKVIVICEISDYAIESHERKFRGGEKSGLGQMQEFLFDFVEKENYNCLSEDEISDGFTVTVWRLPS